MDAGMGAERVHTLEEALATNLIPSATTLNVQQLIGIIDKLFSLFVRLYSKKSIHSLILSLSLILTFTFSHLHSHS